VTADLSITQGKPKKVKAGRKSGKKPKLTLSTSLIDTTATPNSSNTPKSSADQSGVIESDKTKGIQKDIIARMLKTKKQLR
jgi:hypothetical protein